MKHPPREGDLPREELVKRIMSKTKLNTTTGCVEWTGSGNLNGYGQISVKKKKRTIPRLIWELLVGPIPDGLWVLHHCDNPKCLNVSHLFLGTCKDNIRDAFAKGHMNHQRARGEKHGMAKLTVNKVLLIRRLRSQGVSATILSRQFGVTLQQIMKVVRRKDWGWVK